VGGGRLHNVSSMRMSRDYGGFWLWAMLKSLSFEMEWMECEREEDSGVVDGVDGVCVCV